MSRNNSNSNSGGLKLPEPSYDYGDLVGRFAKSYSAEDWETCCASAQALSEKCPMTPLLWLQYARSLQMVLLQGNNDDDDDNGGGAKKEDDANKGAEDPFASVVELGLHEFPGSTLLHYERVRSLLPKGWKEKEEDGQDTMIVDQSENDRSDEFLVALDCAIDAVGTGSHPTDPYVPKLYELQFRSLVVQLVAEQHQPSPHPFSSGEHSDAFFRLQGELRKCLSDWAQHCPNDDVWNDDHVVQFRTSSSSSLLTSRWENVSFEIEGSRKLASQHYQEVRSFEDDVTIALDRQGIGLANPDLDWATLDASQTTIAMGLGDATTARVFVRYAKSFLKQEDRAYHAIQIFERGVAECPTVEALWIEYAEALQRLIESAKWDTTNQSEEAAAELEATDLSVWLSRLESALTRACRNCPYSSRLVQKRIASYDILARHGTAVVDPDVLLNCVRDAVRTGFLLRPVSQPPSSHNQHDDSSTESSVSQIVVDLYQSVLLVIKQRVLFLLTLANPKATASLHFLTNGSQKKPTPISSILQQQLQQRHTSDLVVSEEAGDLLEELRDVYEEMDKATLELLGPSQATTAVRSWLWRDGSHTHQLLLAPLMRQQIQQDESSTPTLSVESATDGVKTLKWMEQAIKLHNPPHPELFLDYLHQLQSISSVNVLQRIQLLRYTFSRAVRSVGRSKTHSHRFRNYDEALRQLCHEWLEFEASWGTVDTLASAQTATHKKLTSAAAAAAGAPTTSGVTNAAYPNTGSSGAKRPPPTGDETSEVNERDTKRPRPNESVVDSTFDQDQSMAGDTNPAADASTPDAPTAQAASSPKVKVVHKVRVGKLDFPAHPYTVKVSNLAPETADMDLVDAFRRCGAIVHARIVRDKTQLMHNQGGGDQRYHGAHNVAPSKGYGLVQFEEREAVESALALHDVIGLNEKVLRVERSHIPAALIVPPGMHRVKEKGHGKYSKRNERRKELAGAHDGDRNVGNPKDEPRNLPSEPVRNYASSQGPATSPPPQKPTGAPASVLSFRPRGVGRGGHQKTRIALPSQKPK